MKSDGRHGGDAYQRAARLDRVRSPPAGRPRRSRRLSPVAPRQRTTRDFAANAGAVRRALVQAPRVAQGQRATYECSALRRRWRWQPHRRDCLRALLVVAGTVRYMRKSACASLPINSSPVSPFCEADAWADRAFVTIEILEAAGQFQQIAEAIGPIAVSENPIGDSALEALMLSIAGPGSRSLHTGPHPWPQVNPAGRSRSIYRGRRHRIGRSSGTRSSASSLTRPFGSVVLFDALSPTAVATSPAARCARGPRGRLPSYVTGWRGCRLGRWSMLRRGDLVTGTLAQARWLS